MGLAFTWRTCYTEGDALARGGQASGEDGFIVFLFYADEGYLRLEGYRAMGDVRSHIERGVAYKINGQYDQALAELRQALQLDPNNAEAHHQLGLVLGFTGEFEQSLAELERAVQLDGNNVVIRNDLALTYAMLGMYEEARAQFEEVLRQDPTNEVALKQIQFFR